MSALPAEPATTGDLPQPTAEDASMTVEASLVPAVPGPPAAPDGDDAAVVLATGNESTAAAAAAAADTSGSAVANRGRGRGARRGTAAKRGSTTAAGAGRGRGKRKSEAAALAEDTGGTGVKPFAVDEPRKKRRAAQSAPRIVESDEETEDVAAPPPQVAPPAVVDTASASPLPVSATRKIKLKVGNRTSTVSPAPAVPESAASPAAAPVTAGAGAQPETTAESVVSEVIQPIQDLSSAELPVDASSIPVNGLQDLFADDPPQNSAIGAEAIAASSGLNQTPIASNPAGASADTSTHVSNAKEAFSKGNDGKLAKAGTPLGAGLSKVTKKSAAGIRPQPSVSKLEAGSETKASGSPLPTKKRLPKAPATQSNTPLSHHSGRGAAPAAPTQASSGSFLDSLFADTIPQTEHERQLQREREEKTRKAEAAAKAAAAKAKKVREDADASKQAADAVALNAQPGSSHLVPASSKPPPITLKSLKRGIAQLGGGGSVLSRLAGSEKSREQEIAKLRASAAKNQEELAKAGGFDLLSQGLEMAAFEAPFLHEWRLHQNAVFGGQGHRSAGTFELYKGSSAASEVDSTLPLQSLPHPWTFGSAFAFSGLPAPVQAGDWR